MELLVGIDFGTTNTIIYYIDNLKIKLLKDNNIYNKIPSKIGIYNEKYYCGNYIPLNCNNIINNFKIDNDNDELYLIFFKHINDIIYKNINNINKIKAVITVPSNFNNIQREKIKLCFEKVNINIIRIINEPSAAALAYGLNDTLNLEEIFLVIDIGGGTTDFTILEKNENFFEVIHSEGINIGGNDFTNLILNDLLKLNLDLDNNYLWNISQNIKEKISYLDNYEINITENYIYKISKNIFYNLCEELLIKYENIINNIINNYNKINNIILIGGTCKINFINDILKKFKIPIYIHPRLEYVVAEGACIYASIIEKIHQNHNEIILLDVVQLSLGVELIDGTFSIIIPKNTPLPVKRNHKYTTNLIGENKIIIKIYQGECKIANKNYLIGEYIFDKISLSTNPIIDITFSIDLNSIINVYITDKKSGEQKHIIIKDIINKSKEDIDNIINKSIILSEIEDIELQKNQNIYIIKSSIENIIINLNNNNLLNNKIEMINNLINIENNLLNKNNLELLEIINYLQNNFSILNNNSYEINIENNDIDLLLFNDKKNELIDKINKLLINNENNELNEILTEINNNNNINLDYIYDKLNIINNYNDKNILLNLCSFIKNEINNNNIILNQNKIEMIFNLINYYENINDYNIDWNQELNIFNNKCQEIYDL